MLGMTAAAQPGPYQAFLLSLISRNGWQRTLPAAFAPLISDGPILLLVLLVLTRLPAWSLSALQISGGLFLLYLAWGAWRTFRREVGRDGSTQLTIEGDVKTNVLKAALMNFLSPGPYIFWTTVAGPILIEAWRITPSLGLAFLGGFYAALIGGSMLLIAIFGGASQIDRRVNRALGGFSAVALFAFALYQLTAGIGGMMSIV